ncbi:MAG: sigma-70 family RNA polymerase sigma factor [Myxococcales bacterium]|nr:sigma-70 family RNA polymerase sigma factor [Myxococcales bacterium]
MPIIGPVLPSAPPSPTTLARRPSADELVRADGFTRYLADIRRYPLLTREEEFTHAEAFYQRGDLEAGKKLVTGNLRLVVKIAMEYRRAWVQVLDLVQEGNIGLAEAVKRFDPYRGVRFSSFARFWIRALILQFILKNFRMVSFANTRAGRKLFFRLEKERAKLMQEFGEATPRLLAERLEVSEDEVVAAETLKHQPLSLTAPRGSEDGRTLSETLPANEDLLEDQIGQRDLMATVNAKMAAFFQTLNDERERAIWTERLVAEDPASLNDLGERFGISRERIRQVEARLKDRLKVFLIAELGTDLQLDVAQRD